VRFQHRIMILPVLAAVAFLAILVLSRVGTTRGERLIERIETEYYAALEYSHNLEMLAVQLPYTLQGAMTAGDPDMIEEAALLRDEFLTTVASARTLPHADQDDLEALSLRCDTYFEVASRATARMIESDIDVDEHLLADLALMRSRHEELLTAVRATAERRRQELRSHLEDTRRIARNFRGFITGIIVACIVAMIVVSVGVIWSVLRPVRSIRDATEGIARGDLHQSLDYRSDDDLGRLADTFRRMQHNLITDIDRREKAEAALRESEERLALAMDAANDGLWDFDVINDQFYASPRYAEILGYGVEELPTDMEGMGKLMHPDDEEMIDNAFEAHLEHGFPFDLEVRMKRKDGDWCWVHSRGKIVEMDLKGRPKRMVGTIVDICTRKEAEQQLLERTEELERTVVNLRETQTQLIQSEKMASLGQMVAGLAHELNNPVGAVSASADVAARARARLEGIIPDPRPEELRPPRRGRTPAGRPDPGPREHPDGDQARARRPHQGRAPLRRAAAGDLLPRRAEPGVPQPADQRGQGHRWRGRDHHHRRIRRRRRPRRDRRHGRRHPVGGSRPPLRRRLHRGRGPRQDGLGPRHRPPDRAPPQGRHPRA